ncbi:Nuclear RNA-binding protein [Malassezia pachydermatis]|uniref:Hyaluronan/mRNA-binding protein domain-containing protein n=1 Tax=Malassezia pachydermatis TaxID=77020 RepID=A0A0M8MJ98_9BASI|nr:hypothetical protein Malapachy_0384 [Malassezia pachydermatis]KOS12658.1 hypothetical protein Malapachy_0384 [Malassezia pachydermatis]
MSVAINNPFQLLGVDGQEEAPAPAAAPAKTETARRNVPGLPRAAEEPVQRDHRGADRGKNERSHRGKGDRSRGGRGGARGGRRAFDRHSMSGREDTAKSVRQGWGGDDAVSEKKLEEGAEADAKADAEAENAEKKRFEEEEQDNTLTLDQYFASQKEKRAQIATVAAPRAVEADESVYGQRLDKGEGESYFAGTEKKSAAPRTTRKEKQTIEIEPVYQQPSRSSDRAPRGGRGGARGGRGDARGARGGRGGARGGRGAARGGRAPAGGKGLNVDIADESAFPSLS